MVEGRSVFLSPPMTLLLVSDTACSACSHCRCTIFKMGRISRAISSCSSQTWAWEIWLWRQLRKAKKNSSSSVKIIRNYILTYHWRASGKMTTDKPMECQWLNLACESCEILDSFVDCGSYCEGQTLETELAPQGLTTAPTTQKHKRWNQPLCRLLTPADIGSISP